MWCPSRFSSWSSTVYLVHDPSQYSHFVTFLEPPPLRWRHTTLLLFLSIGFWLQHHSAPAFSPENIFLDDKITLNSSKTEFLLVGLLQQLAKINTSSLITTHSARNLGFIFDEHLTFSDQISALSNSCYYHICELRCHRPYLDFKTASTIATSIVHSKLDYCNLLYYCIL